MREAFAALFSPEYKRRTIINSLLFTVSIVGLWAGSIYVPTAVTQIARAEGYAAADAARMASYGSMVLSIATIIGCLMAPWLAERFGRRLAMGLYFVALGVAVAIAFGYVFYLPSALSPFFVLIFFLGIGGANFALYTLWLPEQYATELPRQRHRVRQLGRPLRRRGDGVSGRHRDPVVRQPRRSGRRHGRCLRARLASPSVRGRDTGPGTSRLRKCKVQSSKFKVGK